MNREEIEKIVEESARQAHHSHKGPSIDQIRKFLNFIFLVCAAIGLILYFAYPVNRIICLGVLVIGMFLNIIEFFLLFLF